MNGTAGSYFKRGCLIFEAKHKQTLLNASMTMCRTMKSASVLALYITVSIRSLVPFLWNIVLSVCEFSVRSSSVWMCKHVGNTAAAWFLGLPSYYHLLVILGAWKHCRPIPIWKIPRFLYIYWCCKLNCIWASVVRWP